MCPTKNESSFSYQNSLNHLFFSMNRYMNFINKEIVKHNFSVWLLFFLKNSITKMYLIIFMLTFFKKSQNIKLQKF